jgi:esterase FrsA
LLSIAGGRDEAVPLDDLTVITEQGIRQDTLLFSDDRHVASRNRALHLPLAARWLAARLRA